MIFHTCYIHTLYSSLHIKRRARDTHIYGEEIGLICHLESRYQLGTTVGCDEEGTGREWIESTRMSHFLDPGHAS